MGLYPVMHEERYRYGGSYFEEINGAAGARKKHRLRSIFFLLKEYVTMGEYFKRRISYWLALYPWHIGFILIIGFHICTFFAAVVMLLGVPVSAGSPVAAGRVFYYVVLFTGVVSFVSGIIGSIGMAINRLTAADLKDYATPQNYFTYIFCLPSSGAGSTPGTSTPTLSEYRDFWVGLITFKPIMVAPAGTLHIVLFDLFWFTSFYALDALYHPHFRLPLHQMG